MKHKHYDMIVAKAENMDLVVFFNPSLGSSADKWEEATTTLFPAFHPETEYFLCLPQHKEACLHWLNGGGVQLDHFDQPMPNSGVKGNCQLVDFDEDANSLPWKFNHPFMDQAQEIHIKPKKEKRWIAFNSKALMTTRDTYTTGVECEDVLNEVGEIYENHPWQFIEIEVEVTE